MADAAHDKAGPDIAVLSFEQALAELEQIVQKLETGRVSLEDSIEIYARGTALRAHCEEKLRAAEARVEKIVVGSDGTARAETADLS